MIWAWTAASRSLPRRTLSSRRRAAPRRAAFDAFNNIATGYGGTVHFTSSDSQASLPADVVLSGGAGGFGATLQTPGAQTLAVVDSANSALTGTSNPISPAATHFSVSAVVG